MGRMMRLGDHLAAGPARWRARWPALLLPLLAVGTYGLLHSWPAVALAVLAAALIPEFAARLVPFALFAYGAYGVFLAHVLASWDVLAAGFPGAPLHEVLGARLTWGLPASGGQGRQVISYGIARVAQPAGAGYVLSQAIVILAAAAWLLAVTDAPGGRGLARAFARLRGAGGQPKTVPPLLLLPVIFLWEELFSQRLWFDWYPDPGALLNPRAGWVLAVLIFAVGGAAIAWLPQAAAVAAVAGSIVLGLLGVVMCLRLELPVATPTNGFTTLFYGDLTLHGQYYGPFLRNGRIFPPAGGMARVAGQDGPLVLLLTAAQGLALLAIGCLLAPRLPASAGVAGLAGDAEPVSDAEPAGDAELAGRTRALARRVTRLTETRRDATETAAAELRRIERDLHDGAQARLVAVGMTLRAVEELMPANPGAALALVAEARETSSRALADLRDLVRGIYPPVLADRGLADAIRALALDAPLTVDAEITLPSDPPLPVAAAAYFAIAEALTNAVRHAAAETVDITLTCADGLLRCTVTDDGRGGADPAEGTGLAGVERRLATFDGVIAVNSPAGGPTIIAIEIPYAAPAIPYAPAGGSLVEVVRSSWRTRTLI
jgi:signal transduction histidine kinase